MFKVSSILSSQSSTHLASPALLFASFFSIWPSNHPIDSAITHFSSLSHHKMKFIAHLHNIFSSIYLRANNKMKKNTERSQRVLIIREKIRHVLKFLNCIIKWLGWWRATRQAAAAVHDDERGEKTRGKEVKVSWRARHTKKRKKIAHMPCQRKWMKRKMNCER